MASIDNKQEENHEELINDPEPPGHPVEAESPAQPIETQDDLTNEQPLTTNESTSLPDTPEIISEPINLQPMEVHHHGHVHETQKWKEYLFQFLMLFLAVTLGFFIENQREHYIENQRAGVIAASLYADLKSDSADLDLTISLREVKLRQIDSLLIELNKPVRNDSLIAGLSWNAIVSRRYFFSESGTYEQVKNSGALRYYNTTIQQGLVKYETLRMRTAVVQDIENKFVMEQFFPFMLSNQSKNFTASFVNNAPLTGNVFRKMNPDFIEDLYNYAWFSSNRSRALIQSMQNLKGHIRELLAALGKEYKLGSVN